MEGHPLEGWRDVAGADANTKFKSVRTGQELEWRQTRRAKSRQRDASKEHPRLEDDDETHRN